jgi:hypothetical protein
MVAGDDAGRVLPVGAVSYSTCRSSIPRAIVCQERVMRRRPPLAALELGDPFGVALDPVADHLSELHPLRDPAVEAARRVHEGLLAVRQRDVAIVSPAARLARGGRAGAWLLAQ